MALSRRYVVATATCEFVLALLRNLRSTVSKSQKWEENLAQLLALSKDELKICLSEIIQNSDTQDKVQALRAVIWLDEEDGIPLLLPCLKDDDEEVRLVTALILGDYGAYSSISALIEAVSNDASLEVRDAAVFSLGKVGNLEIIKTLTTLRDRNTDSTTLLGYNVADGIDEAIERIKSRTDYSS
jgi:HEAT repeat protein